MILFFAIIILTSVRRSARVGDEIGGHNVSGHVHTTAEIVSIEQTDDNRRIEFKVEPSCLIFSKLIQLPDSELYLYMWCKASDYGSGLTISNHFCGLRSTVLNMIYVQSEAMFFVIIFDKWT